MSFIWSKKVKAVTTPSVVIADNDVAVFADIPEIDPHAEAIADAIVDSIGVALGLAPRPGTPVPEEIEELVLESETQVEAPAEEETPVETTE